MEPSKPLDEQIATNLIKVQSRPEFNGDRGWLTFYLCGPPNGLEKLSHALDDWGWINTEDWEGGFIYPKIEADRTVAAIVELANATQTLCDAYGIRVIAIDADTSTDVERSSVEVLYEATL